MDLYYDVIIVGGGPAGLTIAEKLAKAKKKTIVLEKNTQIGYPVRTTGGTWIRDMHDVGIPENLYHIVSKCRFVSPNKEVVISYPKKEACILNVTKTYKFLANKAITAGAQIKLNIKVLNPIIKDSYIKGVKVQVNKKNISLYSKILIDASGSVAVIAKKVGLQGKLKRYGVGAEYELYTPDFNLDETIIILDNEIAPSGYGWIVPCDNKKLRVGIAVIFPDSKVHPKLYLDKLIEGYYKFKHIFKDSKKLEYHNGIIPSAGLIKGFVNNGLMVVGDAAGQSSPLIGEGIRYVIYAAQLAGKVAIEAINKLNYSEKFLYKYEKAWRKKFERNHKIALKINRKIASFTGDKWDKYLDNLENMTSQQLIKFFRNEFGIWWALSIFFRNPKLSSIILKELTDPFSKLPLIKIRDKVLRRE